MDDAGEDLQQRGLARAVLADQRMGLALGDAELTPAQRPDGAERLADVAKLQRAHDQPVTSRIDSTFRCSRS